MKQDQRAACLIASDHRKAAGPRRYRAPQLKKGFRAPWGTNPKNCFFPELVVHRAPQLKKGFLGHKPY
jgi:hypothetical protein